MEDLPWLLAGGNPLRPLNWRYRRAMELAPDAGPNRRAEPTDDWATIGLRRYLARRRAASEATRRSASRLYPAIHVAFEIHRAHRSAENDAGMRLEARLLAGQRDPSIARQLDTSAEVVAWYSMLFYDVRPLLRAAGRYPPRSESLVERSLAWGNAVGRPPRSPAAVDRIRLAALDPPLRELEMMEERAAFKAAARHGPRFTRAWREVAMKHFAFYGGVHGLEAVLDNFGATAPPGSAADVGAWLNGVFDNSVRTQALQRAVMGGSQGLTMRDLLGALTKLRATAAEEQDNELKAVVQKHIARVAEACGVGPDPSGSSALWRIDHSAVEAPLHDLVRAANGEMSEEEIRAYERVRMPPPRNHSDVGPGAAGLIEDDDDDDAAALLAGDP